MSVEKKEGFEVDRLIDAIKTNKDITSLQCLSEYDGKIVKNHLPKEIKEKFYTKNQWLEKGYMLKEDAVAYEMHPTQMNKKLCCYYLDSDVKPIPDSLESCAVCNWYGQGEYGKHNRYCIIFGGYPSINHHCSEFDKKKQEEVNKISANRR